MKPSPSKESPHEVGKTKAKNDERRRVVGEAHVEAVRLLEDHRESLDSLAGALYKAETLEGPESSTLVAH